MEQSNLVSCLLQTQPLKSETLWGTGSMGIGLDCWGPCSTCLWFVWGGEGMVGEWKAYWLTFPCPRVVSSVFMPGMQGLWACWLRWIKVWAHSLQRRKGRRSKNKSWVEDGRFRYIFWNWNSGLLNFSLGSLGSYHFTKCSSCFVKFRISFLSSSFPPFIHAI